MIQTTVSDTFINMINRDETGEGSDPFRQLRYLPPPQTSQYHQTSQHPFHPQPIRPTVDPACLVCHSSSTTTTAVGPLPMTVIS